MEKLAGYTCHVGTGDTSEKQGEGVVGNGRASVH